MWNLGCCCERAADLVLVHVEQVDAPKPFAGASLDWAVEAGHVGYTDFLLKTKADPNLPVIPIGNSIDATPLILASKHGHEAVVQRLLVEPDVDVNASTKTEESPLLNQQTALHWAVHGRGPCFTRLVRDLCSDSRVEVDATTSAGITPLMLAARSEWSNACEIAQELLKAKADAKRSALDCQPGKVNPMALAITAGRCDVLGVLLDSGQLDVEACSIGDDNKGVLSLLTHGVNCRMSDMVLLLLECQVDPTQLDSDSYTPLERAVAIDAVESAFHLVLKGSDTSRVFSPLRRAQLLGDVVGVREMVMAIEEDLEEVPALHKMALCRSLDGVKKHLDALGSSAKACQDGGHLPAAFYALELGFDELAKVLLCQGHALPERAVELAIAVTNVTPASSSYVTGGVRTYHAAKALLSPIAATCGNREMTEGVLAFFLPWCGSAAALEFLTVQPVHFFDLCTLCGLRCQELCASLDALVTRGVLEKMAALTRDDSTELYLQDSPGLLPELLWDEVGLLSRSSDRYVNTEVCATRTLSVLAFALDDLFQEDMRVFFKAWDVEVLISPPKTFQRMLNKLLSPAEHGSHTLTRPRCMRNLDVLRIGVSVRDAESAIALLNSFKARFDIVRVHNNHDPQGEFSGCRSIVVNFVYDSKVRFRDLFGEPSGSTDFGGETGDPGCLWQAYVSTFGDTPDVERCLEPLWRIAAEAPEATVVLVAELRILLEPYAELWEFLNHLFKISRCHTPAELVRRYAPAHLRRKGKEEHRKARHAAGLARSLHEASAEGGLGGSTPKGRYSNSSCFTEV